MKTSGALVALALAALPFSGCDRSAPAADPPSVVALARPTVDALAAELAAGLALEVGHRLSQRWDLVVREVLAPTAQEGATFADASERFGVDMVIWVEVTGTPEQPVVAYALETAEGERRAASWEAANADELLAAPSRIAEEASDELTGEPSASSLSTWPTPSGSEYAAFVRTLGRTHASGASPAERVYSYEALGAGVGSYPPAVVELGHAYLDLAGTLPGTSPFYDRAEETLRRALELDPLYPPARYVLASCLTKLGRSEEAVALLLEGIAAHPDYPPYHDQLGYVSRYAGLMETSMTSYRRAQQLDPSLENRVATQDQITKSLIYVGDYGEALASHARMEGDLVRLGREPDEKEWFYKGVIHLYAGDIDRALEAFRRGEETNPSTIWTTFGRGYAGIARGDRAAVAEVLDELERSVVVDGERHYRLVHFASYLGERERALEHLEVSIQAGFFNAPYFRSDPLTSTLREDPAFERVWSAAEERHVAFRGIAAGG